MRRITIEAKNYFQDLDLFSVDSLIIDEHKKKTQIISTRLFLISLPISFAILVAYTSTATFTKSITVESPTLHHYSQLYSTYPRSLTCPCTNVSQALTNIIHLSLNLHPVCSSSFVTADWIRGLAYTWTHASALHIDFRLIATFQFQALRSLCNLINETISNGLSQFYATDYVSMDLTPLTLFVSQSDTLINQFIETTMKTFTLSFRTVRNTIEANGLLAGIQTNAHLYLPETEVSLQVRWIDYDTCQCSRSSQCNKQSAVYNNSNKEMLYMVPGFKIGCYPVEALMYSSLECFFNETCFNELMLHIGFGQSSSFKIMNASLMSRFSETTTVGEILDHMMVERWARSVAYEKYYTGCSPKYCMYTRETRNDAIYIITTVIGLIAGLGKVLKIAVPRVIELIRRPRREQEVRQGEFFRSTKILIIDYTQSIRRLNLFASTPPANNHETIKVQIISTRLFVFCLSISFTVLMVYTSALNVKKSISLQSPTLDQYKHLYTAYPQSLTCPCTQISQTYQQFINLDFTLHQVCSSVFVTNAWIDHILKSWLDSLVISIDFRYTATFQFQALKSLCELMNGTITNHLSQFLATEYVTMDVVPFSVFLSEAHSLINDFIITIVKQFALSFRTIRDTIQANGLLSVGFSNVYAYLPNSHGYINTRWSVYNECGCEQSSQCHDQSWVFDVTNFEPVFLVSGFKLGCYPVESLLHSSLECFFDETCFDELSLYIGLNRSSKMLLLDESMLSRFSKTSIIGELLNEMMVERWDRSVMYEKYYVGCRPKQCIYTIQTRNDAIYIVTTVIALIGGLSTVLQILVPPTVYVIHRLGKMKSRIHPTIFTTQVEATWQNKDIRIEYR